MFRRSSKLLQAAIVMALLAMSAALWPSLSASTTFARVTSALAVCPTPGNNACISNTPTAGLTLNGNDQTASYTLAFTLNNSVSGNWHVAITSTLLTAGSHTLSSTASSVTAVTVVPACNGNTCPVNSITYPVSIPAGSTPPAPNTFFNNTGGGSHGVGTFNMQATVQVAVPANTFAGTYTSTVTISFVSGTP